MRCGVQYREKALTPVSGGGVDVVVRWALEDASAAGEVTVNVADLSATPEVLFALVRDSVATQVTALTGVAVTAAEVVGVDGPPGAILDAVTNAVTDVLRAVHSSTGTAAIGLGAGLLFQVENDAGGLSDAVRVAGVLRNVTPATVDGELQFYTRTGGGALSERYRIDGAGNLTMRGDFDFTPATDAQGDLGTSALRFSTATANVHRVFAAAGDANPTAVLDTTRLRLGLNSADNLSWGLAVGQVTNRADMLSGDSLNAIGTGRLEHRTAAADAEASVSISSNLIEMGVGGATSPDVSFRRGAANRFEWGSGDSASTIGAAAFENRAASGDANPRLSIAPSTIDMGPGGASAVDTRLGRGAANRWDIGGDDSMDTLATGTFENRALTGDANPRMQLTSSALQFGPGGGTVLDTVFQRQAASRWETGSGDQLWSVNAPIGRMAASGDANGVTVLGNAALLMGAGGASAPDARVARTSAQTITVDDANGGAADINVVPVVDNNGNLGTGALRWKLVRAVTVTPGDVLFDDQACPVCGGPFAVGEGLVMHVTAIEPDPETGRTLTRTVPAHRRCSERAT